MDKSNVLNKIFKDFLGGLLMAYISSEVQVNELPSNKPLSDNFRAGITNNAINDNVI
jgi:hypothetical protein